MGIGGLLFFVGWVGNVVFWEWWVGVVYFCWLMGCGVFVVGVLVVVFVWCVCLFDWFVGVGVYVLLLVG